MIIKYVELENIRSYVKERIDFKEGITLLWGDIGSGKSTILYAIDFALFGSSSFDANGLVRSGARRSKIKIGFEIDGRQYVVERSFVRQKDGKVKQDVVALTTNGVREELTPNTLKAKIFDILGYPRSMLSNKKLIPFRYTVYIPQERMKEILFVPTEERLKIFRALFDVEKYQRIVDNTKDLIKSLKLKSAHLQGRLESYDLKDQERMRLEQEIKDYEYKILELEKDLKVYEQNLKKYEEMLKAYEMQKMLLQEKQHKKELYVKDVEAVMAQMNKAKRDLEQHIENATSAALLSLRNAYFEGSLENALIALLKEYESKIIDLDKRIDELSKKIDEIKLRKDALEKNRTLFMELEKKISNLSTTISTKEEYLQDLEKKKSAILEEITTLKSKLAQVPSKTELMEKEQTLEQEIKDIENKIKEYEKKIAEFSAMIDHKRKEIEGIVNKDFCPVCKQKIDENHKLTINQEFEEFKSRYSYEIELLKQKIAGFEKDKENKLNEITRIKELKEKAHQNEIIISNIQRLEKDLNALDNEKSKISESLNAFKKSLQELNKKLSDVDYDDKTYEEISNNYKSLLDEKFKLYSQKESLKDVVFSLKNIKSLYDTYVSAKKTYEVKKSEIENVLKVLENEINELSKNLVSLEEDLKEYQKLVESYEVKKQDISKLKGVLDQLRKQHSLVVEDLKSLDSLKLKKQKYEQIIEYLETLFIPMMTQIEKQVMSQIRFEFNAYFTEWFGMLLTHTNLVARIGEGFVPIIEQGEYELDYDYLSGGERQSVALAYRLALNKVINDFIGSVKTKDLLILDEPTDGFSREQMENIRDVLNNLNLRQIIIVSHESEMKDYADNIIKVSKNNDVSTIRYD